MEIIFAGNFIVRLKKVPENIKRMLENEIREHIVYNDALPHKILIEFTDQISYKGEVKFIDSINPKVGFNKNSFYFIHKQKKIEIPNYQEKDKLIVETGFDPELFFEFFEFMYMQKIIENDMTFLHSSGITINDKTVLFPGYAGTGKTLIIIQMLKEYNANFIGDDWCIINKGSNVYPYYKNIHIGWKHIMEYKDVLKKYFPIIIPRLIYKEAGGKFDSNDNKLIKILRLFYDRYFYRNKPAYIGPKEINKNNIIDHSNLKKIDYVIFISRSSITRMNYELISAETLAENMIWVTALEYVIRPDYDNFAIFSKHYNYKLKQQQMRKQKSIMYNCFKRTKNYWLEIPETVSSKEICDFLVREVFDK